MATEFYMLTLHPDSLLIVFQICYFYSLFSRISRYTAVSSTNDRYGFTSFSIPKPVTVYCFLTVSVNTSD